DEWCSGTGLRYDYFDVPRAERILCNSDYGSFSREYVLKMINSLTGSTAEPYIIPWMHVSGGWKLERIYHDFSPYGRAWTMKDDGLANTRF
ncbi:MAG: hypothetical protein RR295_07225, partial [Oscillospiraceae bacterium]